MAKEHLVRIMVEHKDDFIDLYRDPETGGISLCSKDRCAELHELTGLETTNLFSLLEPLGNKVEFPDDAGIEAPILTEGEANDSE